MANPTTNYGFVLPTSSDLVTDLPADFDVALQGVDTRLKALQPGTTLGDLAYSSATANTNTRLAIGTTGQVLTVAGGVPSWATPATPASGLTKLVATTFSAVSSYSAPNNTFSATYDAYKVMVELTGASASGTFQLRARASGSDYTGTGYDVQRVTGISASASADLSSSTSWALLSNNTNTRYFISFDWYKPYGTGQHLALGSIFNNNSSGNLMFNAFGARIDTATQYDAFTVYPASGTITGSVAVYGYSL